MKSSLRSLGALAILETVGFVVAQQIASKSEGGNGPQAAVKGGGDAIVTINGRKYHKMVRQHPGPWKYAEPTGAQNVLQRYIPGETNRLIELATQQGREDTVSKIIEVQCYYMLTVMRPDQQKHEMYDVWDVELWKPNGQWDHVTSAPTLVRELSSMSSQQGARVEAAFARREDEWMKPFMDLNKRIYQEVGKDMDRYRVRYQQELAKLNANKSKAQLASGHVAKLNQGLVDAYAILTPAQRREWDLILSNFRQDAMAAFQGKTPELGVQTK